MPDTAFSFVPRAARSDKPRKRGLTEIRGPYYSAYGQRHLADLLETMGAWLDGIKYAGGSFALMASGGGQIDQPTDSRSRCLRVNRRLDRERRAFRGERGRSLH